MYDDDDDDDDDGDDDDVDVDGADEDAVWQLPRLHYLTIQPPTLARYNYSRWPHVPTN